MPAKRYRVTLSDEERSGLHRLVSIGKAAAYKRRRAQILLKADQGVDQPTWTDQQISEAFDVGRATVEARLWGRRLGEPSSSYGCPGISI